MALVHDMAESIVGDITPYDGVSDADKHQQEEVGREALTSIPS
jgi:putative hydrolases of HD superfamily